MTYKQLLAAVLLLSATIAKAQTSDPMLTYWWFNTTGATYNGILTDVESVYYTTSYVYVKSSGVPDYYRNGVSHNDAHDLHATWVLPRNSVPATTPTGFAGGQEGVMIDGDMMFTPGDAQSYNGAGVWNRLAYFFERMDMDASNGHSTPDSMYHHHFDNLKLHTWDSTTHSPIVAFAWDGYPVYGPYGYANTDGTGGIKRIRSSYKTYSYTTRTNGPDVSSTYPMGCFIEDWQYVSGSGDLDAHNGRFCVTPEYPHGTYAYFTTVDSTLAPYYPYFIGPTLYGTYSNANLGPSGGAATVPDTATQYTTSVAVVSAIDQNIDLYPVPVTSTLTVGLKEDKNYTLVIYNVKGQVIQNEQISSTTKVDMSNLPYGVYFVQIDDKTANAGFIKRIVKM
jgi:YHYH protein/Secretion system C-terminal sorting domain